MSLFAGTIALSDYRLIAGRSGEAEEARLRIWTRIGLLILLTTGPLMFWSDWPRYLHNPAFRLKITAVAIALAFHFTIRRRYRSRWLGLISMALWSCVVLGGRAMADFDLQ